MRQLCCSLSVKLIKITSYFSTRLIKNENDDDDDDYAILGRPRTFFSSFFSWKERHRLLSFYGGLYWNLLYQSKKKFTAHTKKAKVWTGNLSNVIQQIDLIKSSFMYVRFCWKKKIEESKSQYVMGQKREELTYVYIVNFIIIINEYYSGRVCVWEMDFFSLGVLNPSINQV